MPEQQVMDRALPLIFLLAVYHIVKIHFHIQDGIMLHFMNSNTITHKLMRGHQPCSTSGLERKKMGGGGE